MAKATSNQRRRRKSSSEDGGGVHGPRRKTQTNPSPRSSKPNTPLFQVPESKLDRSKDSGQELKNTTHHHKNGDKNTTRRATHPRGQPSNFRRKKRARSPTEEVGGEVVEGVEVGEDEPALAASSDELVATIQEHDRFFSLMLDMIPESLVLPAKQVPESAYASKYMKNKKGGAPQQSKKEESKKNKRARYAADNQKTVLERQQERAREKAQDGVDGNVDGKHDGEHDGEHEDGSGAEEEGGLEPEAIRVKTMDVTSMDALRKKIQDRISVMQKKRTAAEGGRRAKTAEKRSAQRLAKRESKRKGAKARKKGKEEGEKKHPSTAAARATGPVPEGAPRGSSKNSSKEPKAAGTHVSGPHAKPDALRPAAEPQLPPLPSIEDVGDIEFSGLRGVVGRSDGEKRRPPKVGAPGSKMKRLHGLLAAAEEKKQRLAGLRQTDEGKEVARKEGWEDAIRIAGGEEVKDDPGALKKIIKRKEREKAKSAKKWDHRVEGQKKEQAKKQEKREENLKKRKLGGVSAIAPPSVAGRGDAAESAGGKRRRRAGFEGKKHDFINKEKTRGGANGGGSSGRGGGAGKTVGGRGAVGDKGKG